MVWKILVQQLLKLESFELIRKIYHSTPWNSLNMNSLMIPAWKNGAQESEPEPDPNEVNTSAQGPAVGGPLFFLRARTMTRPHSSIHPLM